MNRFSQFDVFPTIVKSLSILVEVVLININTKKMINIKSLMLLVSLK